MTPGRSPTPLHPSHSSWKRHGMHATCRCRDAIMRDSPHLQFFTPFAHPQIAHSFASFTLFLEEAWHACHMSLQGCDKDVSKPFSAALCFPLHTVCTALWAALQIAHSFASFTLFLEDAWHACHMSHVTCHMSHATCHCRGVLSRIIGTLCCPLPSPFPFPPPPISLPSVHPQIAHSFASFTLFLEEEWHACHMSLQGCDKERLDKIHAYRDEMVAKVSPLLSSNRSAPPVRQRLAAASSESSVNGAYLVSCRAHCMAMGPMWHGSTAPRIHNKTMAEAVGDWFFNRQSVALVDCQHPCNPTCT
ncbi:unnamed protein product [Closterium sp. NIES-53]